MVESAINAEVRTGIGDVQRNIHADGFAETLLGKHSTPEGHLFEIAVGGRRDQGHEIVDLQMLLGKSPGNVGFCFAYIRRVISSQEYFSNSSENIIFFNTLFFM